MEAIEQKDGYKKIKVLLIADDTQAQKLIDLNLNHLDCGVFLKDINDKFLLEELQKYQMVLILVSPDRKGIKLLMKIQKAMIESGMKRQAKFIAYTACGVNWRAKMTP